MQQELDWVRRALADRMPSKVAKATGLHVNTITGIRDGRIPDPRISTLNKLALYLVGQGE
jgi:hypothetical protein